MASYPYTQSHGNIKKLFAHIHSAGKPAKANIPWLEMIGLKSKNDRQLSTRLRFLGFTDDNGKPVDEVWLGYKDTGRSQSIMANQIRKAYGELFSLYPDAPRKDDEALRNFFSSKTGLAANMVGFIVNTFKTVCELADFGADPVGATLRSTEKESVKSTAKETNFSTGSSGDLTVNINIQLQIAATDDASIYDKFFESLYKNVLSRDK